MKKKDKEMILNPNKGEKVNRPSLPTDNRTENTGKRTSISAYTAPFQTGESMPDLQPSIPIAIHKCIPTSDCFIGRKKELKKISELLESHRIVILSGMGGIGKTELALQFIIKQSHYNYTQKITWNGEDDVKFDVLLEKVEYTHSLLNEAERNQHERLKVLGAALQSVDESYLLFIDNVDGLTTDFVREIYEKLKCRIILTTRNNSKLNLQGVAKFNVKELSSNERLKIFEKYYGKLSEEQKNIYCESIDVPFGGNTQAIVMAAKMLKEQGLSMEEYAVNESEYLKTNSFSYEFHGEEVFDTVANNLSKFFQISKFLENREVERDILALMSYVMQAGIAERYLKTEFNLANSDKLIRLSKMGLINRVNVGNSGFINSMHPLIAKALNLNGLEPTPPMRVSLVKYYAQMLEDPASPHRDSIIKNNQLEAILKMVIRLRPEHSISSDLETQRGRTHATSSTDKTEGVDLLDVLLDEDNKEPLTVCDVNGQKYTFEQVAVIPDEKLYCILKPISEIEGVADDEAIVFYVDEPDNGPPRLFVVTEEEKAREIFCHYYALLLHSNDEADADDDEGGEDEGDDQKTQI